MSSRLPIGVGTIYNFDFFIYLCLWVYLTKIVKMFIENAKNPGWIYVICGSMFSGKTEELIRRLKRAKFANLNVEIFKPRIDVRYSDVEVVSHDSNAIL